MDGCNLLKREPPGWPSKPAQRFFLLRSTGAKTYGARRCGFLDRAKCGWSIYGLSHAPGSSLALKKNLKGLPRL